MSAPTQAPHVQPETVTHHGDHGHGHGHDGHGESHGGGHPTTSTFITIWLVLGFLTIVELAVPQVYDAEWNRHTKWILLVFLAVGKAMLVGLYFMHLKWEAKWLKWIALMPVYMGVAAVILMCEEVWRGSVR